MNEANKLIDKLDSRYFWDVDVSSLQPNTSKRLIIERVFTLGDVKDIKLILEFYGEEEVIEQLTKIPFLDAKTLNFISILFKKPKNEFRCSTKKQSTKSF